MDSIGKEIVLVLVGTILIFLFFFPLSAYLPATYANFVPAWLWHYPIWFLVGRLVPFIIGMGFLLAIYVTFKWIWRD